MMKQRVIVPLLVVLLAGFGICFAQETFEEGKHYQRAPNEIAENPLIQELGNDAKSKVLVFEFFSYGCHWCYKVDPFVSTWYKKAPFYVDFQRVPVEFHPDWAALTRTYYTAKDLNALDKVHVPFFEAVQNNQISNVSDATLRQFFVSRGIKAQDFDRTFMSFDVDRKRKWANSIAKAYRITAVPIFVVQGPKGIFVTSLRMSGSEDKLIKTLEYLVQIEHQALSKEEKNVLQQKSIVVDHH